jgi:hypothetical protein
MSLTFDPTLKKTLGDELLHCQILKTPENRQVVLNNLPYGQKVPSSTQADVHTQNIIDTALGWPRGLEIFIDVVFSFETETLAMQDAFKVLDRASAQPVGWEQVTRLKEILNAERFDDELLTRLCKENSPAAPSLPANAEGHELLSACVEVLARWPHPKPDDAPLLAFLYALLPSVQKRNTRDDCVRWMTVVAQELGMDLEAVKASARQKAEATPPAEHGIPYMLVTVQRDDFDPDNEILIKGWLYHGGGYKPLIVDAGPHTHDKLPLLMRQLIFDSQNKLLKEAGRPLAEASKLIIELFLPINLLGSEIDQWTVQLGKWAGASPLERHYLVVVRSYERVYDEEVRAFSWGLWQDKWNRRPVLPQMLTQANVYLACKPSDYTNSFYDKLALAQVNLFFLGLTVIPPPGAGLEATAIFGPMVQAGTPIAIWLRRCGEDVTAVQAELEDLIYKNDLDSIPQLIYQRRRELWDDAASSVWKSVSLLWDDPDRLPPDVDMQAELQAPKAREE